MKDTIDSVDIRPSVSILSILPHVSYKPWFALAEFVDNSLQSYLSNKDAIEDVMGRGFKLTVNIEITATDEGRITIRDNAAGIQQIDYPRAFRAATAPPDRQGLSEFGMGMKSAACWFANYWSVRTSAIGEPVERTIVFDIAKIVHDDIESLDIQLKPVNKTAHYTEVILMNLGSKLPKGRTIAKIKEHLGSIYRVFIRQDVLRLSLNGDNLKYVEPSILVAPFYKSLSDDPVKWLKKIKFDFGLGLTVSGFAALREVGNVSEAGFSLFRRNRLIEGSIDETYRPELIFGKSNSYTYQRLFGELHLEGFNVSHTKNGFQWEEYEEEFLSLLRGFLNEPPLLLLDQAEGHRVRLRPKELKLGAEKATRRTAETVEREVPQILLEQITNSPEVREPPFTLDAVPILSHRTIEVDLNGLKWEIVLELSNDPSIGDWIEICDQLVTGKSLSETSTRYVGLRLSLAHPFMERFGGTDSAHIEPLLRVAVAIALAETSARLSGVKQAGTIRRNVNDLLRNALSKP